MILLNRIPPSKEPKGIRFKKPKKIFKTPTLDSMLINKVSFVSKELLITRIIKAVKKEKAGLIKEIFILPKAVLQSFSVSQIAPRKKKVIFLNLTPSWWLTNV